MKKQRLHPYSDQCITDLKHQARQTCKDFPRDAELMLWLADCLEHAMKFRLPNIRAMLALNSEDYIQAEINEDYEIGIDKEITDNLELQLPTPLLALEYDMIENRKGVDQARRHIMLAMDYQLREHVEYCEQVKDSPFNTPGILLTTFAKHPKSKRWTNSVAFVCLPYDQAETEKSENKDHHVLADVIIPFTVAALLIEKEPQRYGKFAQEFIHKHFKYELQVFLKFLYASQCDNVAYSRLKSNNKQSLIARLLGIKGKAGPQMHALHFKGQEIPEPDKVKLWPRSTLQTSDFLWDV